LDSGGGGRYYRCDAVLVQDITGVLAVLVQDITVVLAVVL
jgi:hypothetical protein